MISSVVDVQNLTSHTVNSVCNTVLRHIILRFIIRFHGIHNELFTLLIHMIWPFRHCINEAAKYQRHGVSIKS